MIPEIRGKILSSLARFGKLMELEAPDPVLANEAVLLFHLVETVSGSAIWSKLGELSYWNQRRMYGLCGHCDNKLDAAGLADEVGQPLCATCRDGFDESNAKIMGDEQ